MKNPFKYFAFAGLLQFSQSYAENCNIIAVVWGISIICRSNGVEKKVRQYKFKTWWVTQRPSMVFQWNVHRVYS